MTKPHMFVIDEAHLLAARADRIDIGASTVQSVFATGGKRNIRLVWSNQLMSNTGDQILANLGCRIVTRLTNPKCIWTAQRSMGLTPEQAQRIPELNKREVIVQYGDCPRPFLVRVDDLRFLPRPDEAEIDATAEAFLARVTWAEDALREQAAEVASEKPVPSKTLGGDALKVALRLAGNTAEPIIARCDALGMDRACEIRARRRLEAKGYIKQASQTIGGKTKFYEFTPKGLAWAREHGVKVTRYKSGPVHEYLLNQVERAIGAINTRFSFQRHSDITREHSLQPDSVLHLPGGQRIIIEICCNNFAYEARNLMRERQIDGVDMVIAVTPTGKLKGALRRALEKQHVTDAPKQTLRPFVLLDASECLNTGFDWTAVWKGRRA